MNKINTEEMNKSFIKITVEELRHDQNSMTREGDFCLIIAGTETKSAETDGTVEMTYDTMVAGNTDKLKAVEALSILVVDTIKTICDNPGFTEHIKDMSEEEKDNARTEAHAGMLDLFMSITMETFMEHMPKAIHLAMMKMSHLR